jgi:cellulase (glycosyl hydrolase family 5)
VIVMLVLLLVLGGVSAALALTLPADEAEAVRLPETAMPGRLLVGFQDDPSLRWADDRARMLDRARKAGATVIRTTVDWAAATPQRPSSPRSPFDPAYRLADVDDLARQAQLRGIELLITIWGTPGWANGGQGPNRPPQRTGDLADFAQAIADRYSGRHPGYPAVRLFSAWNEPNLELFLAPQFDAQGRPAAPAAYARIAQAIYDGVKRGNADALVAVGETSARGRDSPAAGPAQESHSPGTFARLLAEENPDLSFDAWAQHPYPTRPNLPPAEPVRWPGVGLTSLERFGRALEGWFGRDEIPLWLTEYGHETQPAEELGVPELDQARFAREALGAAAGNPRVRMLVWFVLRDSAGNPWKSGLIDESGELKPAFHTFRGAARVLDARNPTLPAGSGSALVPALELAHRVESGSAVDVTLSGRPAGSVPLRRDGWLDVPLEDVANDLIELEAVDVHGNAVSRRIRLD